MNIKIALVILSLASLTIVLPTTYAETTANKQSDQQTITLDIQNMTCTLCQFTIKKALKNVAGVQQVTVDYDSKTAIVIINPGETNSEALIKASTNAGYPATERLEDH